MKPVFLALSFIRVPRLFTALLLWPLIVGALVAGSQIFLSSIYLRVLNETPQEFEKRLMTEDPFDRWLRDKLYGGEELPQSPEICRWQEFSDKGAREESSCAIGSRDVVIKVEDPASFDPSDYVRLFERVVPRIHICRNCSADIAIDARGKESVTKLTSLDSVALYLLLQSENNRKTSSLLVNAKQSAKRDRDLGGTVLWRFDPLKQDINLSKAPDVLTLVLNTAVVLFIIVWLALRGHRKVLEYFVRNNALLPLVSACGTTNFYASLWVITFIRVLFFLFAVLPATIAVYVLAVPKETLEIFIGPPADFILWLASIVGSLCAVTIVASIAELKERHSPVSFVYRYLPLILWCAGTGIWGLVLLWGSGGTLLLHNLIACIPIVGFSPLVLSPVFHVAGHTLALHALLSSALVIVILRHNSRWFAAHLEEL